MVNIFTAGRIQSKFRVYPDGRVCISILHAPGDDPNGYELASERWTPVHTNEKFLTSCFILCSQAFINKQYRCSEVFLIISLTWSYGDLIEVIYMEQPPREKETSDFRMFSDKLEHGCKGFPKEEFVGGKKLKKVPMSRLSWWVEMKHKDWRDGRDEFKKKVRLIVRRSQEML
ncbi:hypothetical protein M5K25_011711 [Dendrobium thyrsiflorum]|uniref:Uncharacterized protein n=1 Tax=Dendrobium thyrsiflorum TaxID=117978 RepID=A0ABD0V3S9_DENTH